MVPLKQIVDVGPVGHYHTVPVQTFLHPTGQKFPVGMCRDAVYGCGIDHHRQSACLETILERAEKLLFQIILGHNRRCPVFSRDRNPIGHEMLYADCDMFVINVVRIIALESLCLGDCHLSVKVGILAEALPLSWPDRITAKVHDR